MRAPLVIPAFLLLDAIVVAREQPFSAALALAALAVLATLLGRTPAHAIAAVAVAAGLMLGTWRSAPPQLQEEVENVTVHGVVVSDVAAREWGDSFELLAPDGRRYIASLHEHVEAGEQLAIQGRLEPFDDPRNPGEPSPRELARERGLFARLTGAQLLARAPPDVRDVRTLTARLRALADRELHRRLAEPDATILAGMLYGARGALPAELRAEFQDTGTVHVLVTAGLHLGVVAALVTYVLSHAGAGRIRESLVAIPLIWAYAALSGGHLPSLRAATMATVMLAARALGERPLSFNTLALAAIVVAALWPAWVGGASFELSFSCVAAIALFAEPIARALERIHVPGPLREALALTLSTQIGVWPLTAATFLVIAPYAALANLFVVPVVGVALLGGIALLAASPLDPLAGMVAHLETWPLAWIESAVHLIAILPAAHVVATPSPPWTVAIYDLAMIAAGTLLRANAAKQD